jgi:hypothetical protein
MGTRNPREMHREAETTRAQWSRVRRIGLEREKNWVRWKNKFYPSIDKEVWSEIVDGREVGMGEATKEKRCKLMVEPEE